MEKEKEPNYPISLLNKPQILNRQIYLFIYSLLKKIFIKSNQNYQKKLDEHLNKWINQINTEIIRKNEYYISTEYSKNNLRNILLFVKKQNIKYNGDIIENILIYIFSLVFKTEQDNTFSKYIFNNLTKLREHNNLDLIDWIQKEKILPKEFQDLKELFECDGKEDDNYHSEKQKESVFYYFLHQILEQKYPNDIFHSSSNLISTKYIHNTTFFNFYVCDFEFKKLLLQKKASESVLDKDIISNSLMNIVYNLSSKPQLKQINQIIRSFFTQVFIYYQNKNSPLLKYTIPSEGYATIPFVYDLRGACIEGRFSHVVLSPLMIQDFISKIFLKQNNFRELGLFELGKILVFNNNIKNIECDTCLIKSQYLDFFTFAMGLFDNYSIEEINFSYNYLREFSEEFLTKILTHCKGLKTLNISSNEMKRGLGNVFVILKKLYRRKKIKLENLILNKCILDDASLDELGDLLKCKFCKLKKIVLNNNPYPHNNNFLKKLKKNKILEEIYLNKDEISNSYVDYFLRIISNTNIKCLYLFKNKFNNFNDFLRILYRTKIIKKNKLDNIIILNEETSLINLDLSNNDYIIKNPIQIKLLKKLIEETSLYCLDICHILYGNNPEKWKETQDNAIYKKNVEEIKSYLEEIKNEYGKVIKKIRINEVDVKNNKILEKEKSLLKYIKNEEKIKKILEDEKAIYSGFLLSEAENIIENENLKEKEENKDNIDDYEMEETIVEKLKNYLVLKRSEKALEELKIQKYKKKLIII